MRGRSPSTVILKFDDEIFVMYSKRKFCSFLRNKSFIALT